jgi:phosphatidylglycerophosphate synthase
MANGLTAVRLLLVLPFGSLMTSGNSTLVAALIFIVAVASDLLDGHVARRMNTASPLGGTFDHTTDFLFVMSGMIGGARRSVFPWLLPALIATAFCQYFVDSRWLGAQRGLRKSQLGRYNGILYFAPLGGDILVRLDFWFLQPLLPLTCWLLVASTGVSICQRLMHLWRSRAKDRALPVEQKAARSSR